MAGHPLRSATDRRLGGLLSHQLANQTRVHLIPPEFFTPCHATLCAYAVLPAVSSCYPPVQGRLPTRYSPVRHSVISNFIPKKSVANASFDLHVLSTPPAFILSQDQTLNKMVFKEPKSLKSYYRNFSKLQRNLRSSVSSFACLRTTKSISGAFRLSRCLIYKVHAAPCGGFLSYHIQFALSRTFFELFQTLLSSHSPLP